MRWVLYTLLLVEEHGLCAFTPSRGVISVRGNWPLTPTMNVVVLYARTMADLLEVRDVVVAEAPDKRGDLRVSLLAVFAVLAGVHTGGFQLGN